MRKMKKILIIVLLIVLGSIIYFKLNERIETSSDEGQQLNSMRITIVGGSNMLQNGARNSNCYLIRTNQDKLIVVDGGEIRRFTRFIKIHTKI